MNPYHAQHLPQQPPRPPPPPPLSSNGGGGGGFRGGANNNNNSGMGGGGGGSSSAIGFGNNNGSNNNSRHQRGGPPPSSSSAPSRGVVFFSIRPGEHPATVNGPRGKIAVDFNGGAMTDVVLDQIAEMHGISRSKFTVTATDPSRGSDILKPTDRLLNYDRITVFVIAADISGGGGGGGDSTGGSGMGNNSGNSGTAAGGGGGTPLLSGSGGNNNNNSGNNNNISGRNNSSRNGGITVVDDDVFESSSSARINSVVVSDRIVSSAKAARENGTTTIEPMSLDREVELTGLDLPLNLSQNERPEEEAVTGSGPICTLCSYPVIPTATQQEYTFTSPDSLQTHCCLRFACEQCCRYAVDVLGSPSDKCPICAGLTDEALARSILSQQAAAAVANNSSSSSAFIKFDGGIVKGEGGTATPTTINTAVDIGVKRERCDEEQRVHHDSNYDHLIMSVKQEQDGGHQAVVVGGGGQQQEGSSPSCVVMATGEGNVESDDDDDEDDLLDGGGTLMF